MKILLWLLVSVIFSSIITILAIKVNNIRQKEQNKTAMDVQNTKLHRILTFIFFLIIGLIIFYKYLL